MRALATNERAVTQLRTWLHAVNIEYRASTSGNDLTLRKADGSFTELAVVLGPTTRPPGTLVIRAEEVTGRYLGEAFKIFRKLQKTLGYKPRLPVDRGPIPQRKARYTDSFELVAFRHMELRRSPNPEKGVLEDLASIVNQITMRFFKTNRELCYDHVLELGDLRSYALIWATNFVSLHALPPERAQNNGNRKLLTVHLLQRFQNFRDLLWQKARETVLGLPPYDPKADGYYQHKQTRSGVNSIGHGECTVHWANIAKVMDDETDEDYVERHRELDTRTVNARRLSAISLLEKNLAGMPHDAMVDRLTEASDNRHIHPDAQKLAKQRLRDHESTCTRCNPLRECA